MEASNQRVTVQAALCLVGCLHLITFTSVLLQSPLLFGQYGLQPISAYLQVAAHELLPEGANYMQHAWMLIMSNPTLLWLHAALGMQAEAMFALVCVTGVLLSMAAACGVLHPLVFGALWVLYLSIVGVGQAFLHQPGDTLLLEITFACIWLSPVVLPKARSSSDAGQQQQQQQQQKDTHPAALLMRWLLFKLLLLSSSIKATAVCAALPGLAACFRALAAHGPPHSLTWLVQALPSPVAALLAAVALLELPSAFLVLCPSRAVHRPAAAGLLALQLGRVVLGSAGLANLAAVVLAFVLLDDGVVVPSLRWFGQALEARGLLVAPASDASAAPETAGAGAGSAELMTYKTGGRHHRSLSADSLGSLLSDPDLTPPAVAAGQSTPFSAAGLLRSRKAQSYLAAAVVVAAVMFSYSGTRGLVLRLSSAQLTAVLRLLGPAASIWWLAYIATAAFVMCQQALKSARQAAASLAAKISARQAAAAAAAAAADKAKSTAAAPSAAKANGFMPPDLLSPPLSPVAAPRAAAAEAPAGSLTSPKAEPSTDAAEHASKPARRGKAGSGKAAAAQAPSGTPTRKGGRGKTASTAFAAALAEEEQEHSDATHAVAATPTKGKRAAGARGKKAAAGEDAKPTAGPSTVTNHKDPAVPASQVGQTEGAAPKAAAAQAPSATPAPAGASTPAAGSTARSSTVSRTAHMSMAEGRLLLEQAQPWLPAVWAVLVAGAVLVLVVVGLPAVLVPAGYSQTRLRAVPGLLPSYRFARNLGMVSGSSNMLTAWQATATAAHQLPGSYLAFQFSTGTQEAGWTPVRFKQGLGSLGLGGTGGSWLDGLGAIRGPYEPRLQGRLAAAGKGDVAENMWLLHLADMLLEGSTALAPVLEQPVHAHDWVKIDLVRYTPTTLVPASEQQATAASWHVEQVQEVLPGVPRGDPDLKEALSAFGWAQQPAIRSAGGTSVPPVPVVCLLLGAVALWHIAAPAGLIHSVRVDC